ncbi:MAG: cytochrome C [bacterium]|nr:cytochrome C [bacterium]
MKYFSVVSIFTIALVIALMGAPEKTATLTPLEELGKKLFFDERLSTPEGQSCAECHAPKTGWTGPDSEINKNKAVYPGAMKPRFGNRKPPTAAYAGMSPNLHRDEEGAFVGGMFFDGRAPGWELDDPLAEQAMGPFINPLEHNNRDEKSVVKKVAGGPYVALFKKVFGPDSLSPANHKKAYVSIGRAIAAFERSLEVSPYNSKFDDFRRRTKKAGLKVEDIGKKNYSKFHDMGLTKDEVKGLMLFNTKGECAECHVMESENGKPPVFTDFTYDNLGVPKNPDNPFYVQAKEFNPDGKNWIDPGLAGFLETTTKYKKYAAENFGKHKVPTLRNVDRRPDKNFVKAFMHNGCFKTLKEVVAFYNTRDKDKKRWPAPETTKNMNKDELGDLGLTEKEEDLIVLFLKTLSDK